ncbi:hypothetical protein Tco_0528216 [Tanacetum coccineum]
MINQQPNATEITENMSPNFWKFNNMSSNEVFGNKVYGDDLKRIWLDMVLEFWKFMAMVVVCGGSMVVKWCVGTPMATKPLDADLSGTPIDQTKYRSIVGALMYLTEVISYSAGYQRNMTALQKMSLAEAEYVSLFAFSVEVLWLRTQLTDYGFHFDKIPMYYDSKEQVEKGIVELFFVRTEYQLADLFTKALLEDRFKYLVAFDLLRDALSAIFGLSELKIQSCHDSEEIRYYTHEVSSPFEDLSDIGSPRADDHELLELPYMPEDPYVEAALQAPPSPDYVPGPEEPGHAPPSPDYVPGAEHADDEIVAEDQRMSEDASPIALSPDYVPESDPEADPEEDGDEDPEEDPIDYPADGGDDGDDEMDIEEDEDDDMDIEAEGMR